MCEFDPMPDYHTIAFMNVKKIVYSPFSWLAVVLLGMIIFALVLTPTMVLAINPLPAPPPIRDERFGVVQAYEAPEASTAAGVGWTRVLFWWHQMQINGPNDWNPYYFPNEVMQRELDSDRKLIGIALGTPDWASESGSPRAIPDGLYLPYDHPDNRWGQFMYRIVKEYKGKIDHWVIWNEPDVWDDEHPGKTWNGTIEDYVQLLKVGYQAAKAANPDSVVMLTATTYWWDVEYGRELYFPKLLEAIRDHPEAAYYNDFFDMASLHLYFKPEQIYDITRQFRDYLDRYGFSDKPLWINEMNAPPSNDPQHPAPDVRFHVTQEQQTYFLIQAWTMFLAGGADQVSFYKMRDEPQLPSGAWPYGMVRKDGSLRPVFWAYRTLVTYLGQYKDVSLVREGDIRRAVVSRGQLGTTTVVWNMAQQVQEVLVPATSDQALLVDPYGPVHMITPESGYYRLWLLPSEDGHIGGLPFMVVEGAGIHLDLERPTGPDIPSPALILTPLPSPTALPTSTPSANPLPPAPTDDARDWSIPNGRFFTQTVPDGKSGYRVVDDEDAAFWSEYQRLGGSQTIGYPISQRYEQNGFVTQAFQKLILQWRPTAQQAWPVNLFDQLSDAKLDKTLFNRWQIPNTLPGSAIDPPSGSWDEIVIARQRLLEQDPAIYTRYFSSTDPLTVFGLPTSGVEDMGSHYALRTQRAVFQNWKEEVPWAAKGQVTVVNGGMIAKQLGRIPDMALIGEVVPRP